MIYMSRWTACLRIHLSAIYVNSYKLIYTNAPPSLLPYSKTKRVKAAACRKDALTRANSATHELEEKVSVTCSLVSWRHVSFVHFPRTDFCSPLKQHVISTKWREKSHNMVGQYWRQQCWTTPFWPKIEHRFNIWRVHVAKSYKGSSIKPISLPY